MNIQKMVNEDSDFFVVLIFSICIMIIVCVYTLMNLHY